uniref:collagen alpha-1(I) chain-like n=1 Tax=Nyctereutes procyonoides TaxID=34880 RepID=UPI002443CCD6|nr:collagen alpha-1(I) chain-like [Nyctereutes procyonoides]
MALPGACRTGGEGCSQQGGAGGTPGPRNNPPNLGPRPQELQTPRPASRPLSPPPAGARLGCGRPYQPPPHRAPPGLRGPGQSGSTHFPGPALAARGRCRARTPLFGAHPAWPIAADGDSGCAHSPRGHEHAGGGGDGGRAASFKRARPPSAAPCGGCCCCGGGGYCRSNCSGGCCCCGRCCSRSGWRRVRVVAAAADPAAAAAAPVSGTRRRCQGKLAAPLPSNKPGPTRREDPQAPPAAAHRVPNARRAEPARLPETASALIGRRRARPPGSGGALGAGGGEPGPGELPGARPASLRPAGVRPGLGTVPSPSPRTPHPALPGEDGHLGWAGNRRCAARVSTRPEGSSLLISQDSGI